MLKSHPLSRQNPNCRHCKPLKLSTLLYRPENLGNTKVCSRCSLAKPARSWSRSLFESSAMTRWVRLVSMLSRNRLSVCCWHPLENASQDVSILPRSLQHCTDWRKLFSSASHSTALIKCYTCGNHQVQATSEAEVGQQNGDDNCNCYYLLTCSRQAHQRLFGILGPMKAGAVETAGPTPPQAECSV